MDAYRGAERQVSLNLSNKDKVDARIKIPPGIETGKKMRLKGQGAKTPFGTRGDLYLRVKVMNHPDYVRKGNDIEVEVPVPYTLLCLGGSLDVPTPEGVKQIKLKPGMQNGIKVRLKGLGFPLMSTPGSRGDLFAVLNVKIPDAETIDETTRNLLEKLQAAGF
jgi:curved DNA-binding protein